MLRIPAAYNQHTFRIAAVGLCLFFLCLLEREWQILPETWTMAYKAPAEDTVAVWRESRYLGGVAGTTLWENVYLHNGTFHVMSSEALPEPGYVMCDHPTVADERPPARADRWRVVDRATAREIMGGRAVHLKDTSYFFNDESSPNMVSFLGHYYHYMAEVFLAAWRVSASFYGPELPARIMFRVKADEWHDAAGLVDWLHHAVLPHTLIQGLPGGTVMFDKLVIVDRFAAHQYGSPNVTKWNAMMMDMKDLTVPKDWMVPLQDSLATFVQTHRKANPVPVVTYLNRQRTGRRLRDEDAKSLLVELDKLVSKGEIVLHDRFFEDMTPTEQFSMILNTDILLGVHGNGLTHQMWMKRGSAVVEIMGEGGFAIIFPWLADLMGHKHLAVHNDHIFTEDQWTRPDGSAVGLDGDFRTDHIRVSGTFVAGLVEDLARNLGSQT